MVGSHTGSAIRPRQDDRNDDPIFANEGEQEGQSISAGGGDGDVNEDSDMNARVKGKDVGGDENQASRNAKGGQGAGHA